ncbi:MAG: hypothetical protein HQL83_13315, partial [Magnetococcales bacterium]|nr:hypothetical protein [Magnetococcales bacterium]
GWSITAIFLGVSLEEVELMNASMDHRAAAGFNRHLFATDHPGDQERSAYYRMFFGRDSQPTAVMNRIPRRQEATHG